MDGAADDKQEMSELEHFAAFGVRDVIIVLHG
jgi:hypothetical protein